MRVQCCLMLLCVALFAAAPVHARDSSSASESAATKHSTLAESNGVGIDLIRIAKKRVAEPEGDTDTSSLVIELWLTRSPENDTGNYSVRLLDLSDVKDNTGKLLSTPERRKAIRFLGEDLRTARKKNADGKAGPTFGLTFDVPAREATSIASLRGKAVLSTLTSDRLKFEGLEALNGKALSHADFKGATVTAKFEVNEDRTTVELTLPTALSNSIVEWGLGKDAALLNPIAKDSSAVDGQTTLTKQYKGEHVADSFLGILFAKPVNVATYDFEFTDVDLP
jgi:hypothetical protein